TTRTSSPPAATARCTRARRWPSTSPRARRDRRPRTSFPPDTDTPRGWGPQRWGPRRAAFPTHEARLIHAGPVRLFSGSCPLFLVPFIRARNHAGTCRIQERFSLYRSTRTYDRRASARTGGSAHGHRFGSPGRGRSGGRGRRPALQGEFALPVTVTPALPPAAAFAELDLPPALMKTLTRLGMKEPFPIQAATLPNSLAGRDVLGRGRTGSGKTLAFGLALLTR